MEKNIESIVEIVRNAFQTRDFGPMVECFAGDGIYETPYAFENNRSKGIETIRKRFAQVSDSPWNKAVKIDTVVVKSTPGLDGETVFAEFEIKGVRVKDQVPFDFPSSVAIIQIRDGQIINYRDYPNVAGIRKAAGIE